MPWDSVDPPVCDKHDETKVRRLSGGKPAGWRCRSCNAEYCRRWHVENRLARQAYDAARNIADREKRRLQTRRWRDANKDRIRDTQLRNSYGLSLARVERMEALQGGACAHCRRPFETRGQRSRCVDHCHATGRVRGLLCLSCNQSLGKLGDSPHQIRRLLGFLEATA